MDVDAVRTTNHSEEKKAELMKATNAFTAKSKDIVPKIVARRPQTMPNKVTEAPHPKSPPPPSPQMNLPSSLKITWGTSRKIPR
jgi:hypothetical protein